MLEQGFSHDLSRGLSRSKRKVQDEWQQEKQVTVADQKRPKAALDSREDNAKPKAENKKLSKEEIDDILAEADVCLTLMVEDLKRFQPDFVVPETIPKDTATILQEADICMKLMEEDLERLQQFRIANPVKLLNTE